MAPPTADSISYDPEAARRCAEATRQLWVDAGCIPSWARGALDDYIGSRIEERLAQVDALGRSGSVPRAIVAQLDDQLYRARLVGYDGLLIAIESFDGIAPSGVLSSDDSAALLGWLAFARQRRVGLVLPEAVRALRGYRHSEPIAVWLAEDAAEGAEEASEDADEAAPAPAQALAQESSGAPSSADALPTAVEATLVPAFEPVPLVLGFASEATPLRFDAELPLGDLPSFERELAFADPAPEPAAAMDAAEEPDDESQIITRRLPDVREASRAVQISLFTERSEAEAPTQVSEEVARAQLIRELSAALGSARGATSFAALEELFSTAYCPLEQAIAETAGHSAQREVLEGWARQFEACYEQAFTQMCRTRQRPRMVFDAPKIAFQLSRAHEAPGFELVLVDAFRFDVGQKVFEKLRLQLTGQAECVARGLLWAPLPSNTAACLELLARGADGLRSLRADLSEASVVSIKEARKLRKLRAGPHALYKLDAVQALLEPGKSWDRRGLEQLASEVSVSSARFIKQRAPGTLVLLFGDHGFRLEDGGHGGASPEEVLVPYQAWRVLDPAHHGGGVSTAAE